jgi:hypothetical protein
MRTGEGCVSYFTYRAACGGFTSLLTARMAERLKAPGLAEQKVGGTAGGTGLTEQAANYLSHND